jgi:putative ABC transport system substrate-binding protein
MADMRRREFITLVGGAAVAWPLAARAQQPLMPVVGILDSAGNAALPFRKGLHEMGYLEGRNVAIEMRSTEQYGELPALAKELVRQRVAAIAALGGLAAPAAKGATTTISIVFSIGGDPVELGLVASLNHPGGNITGVTFLGHAALAKASRHSARPCPQGCGDRCPGQSQQPAQPGSLQRPSARY